jgi:hypothetical protein
LRIDRFDPVGKSVHFPADQQETPILLNELNRSIMVTSSQRMAENGRELTINGGR